MFSPDHRNINSILAPRKTWHYPQTVAKATNEYPSIAALTKLVASIGLESFVIDDGRIDEHFSIEPGSGFVGGGVAHHSACIQSSLAQANCQQKRKDVQRDRLLIRDIGRR